MAVEVSQEIAHDEGVQASRRLRRLRLDPRHQRRVVEVVNEVRHALYLIHCTDHESGSHSLTFESVFITAKNSVLRPSENKMPLLSRDLPLPLGADAVEEHALLRMHYLCGTYGGRRLGASGPDVRSKVSVVNSPSFADTCFRLLRCLRRCARARGAGS